MIHRLQEISEVPKATFSALFLVLKDKFTFQYYSMIEKGADLLNSLVRSHYDPPVRKILKTINCLGGFPDLIFKVFLYSS